MIKITAEYMKWRADKKQPPVLPWHEIIWLLITLVIAAACLFAILIMVSNSVGKGAGVLNCVVLFVISNFLADAVTVIRYIVKAMYIAAQNKSEWVIAGPTIIDAETQREAIQAFIEDHRVFTEAAHAS